MPRSMMVPLAFAVLVLGIASAGAQQAEQGRIGVYDQETVWKVTEVGKKYNSDLSEARDRLQAEIDKKQAEIDAVRDKLRQQQASLSDDKAAQMQKDIQNRVIELNRLQDDATREMKSQLGEVQNRFQQMLVDTVEAFGKEKNYALILNKGVIDYNAPQIDVTQSLVQKFNEMHKVPPSTAAKPQPKKTPDKPKDSGGL